MMTIRLYSFNIIYINDKINKNSGDNKDDNNSDNNNGK